MMLRNFIIAALSGLFFFSSCNKEVVINNTEVSNVVSSGVWKITNYMDSGKNETSDFKDFSFTFNADGSVIAKAGNGNQFTGVWNTIDESFDDNPKSSSSEFNLFFIGSDLLEEINEDWHILTMTKSKIELTHVSGGNGGINFLTFEKK